MYSEATLTTIRSSINIVELVGEYVQLKKSGQGYLGLCPFHGEKTPSFHVHPIKQCFHCFGCHKGGNIFTFLCAIEGLSFPEAVQKLAKHAGITLEETSSRRVRPEANLERDHGRLLSAMEWAAKYFHYLLTEAPEYRSVREYAKRRGLSESAMKKFRLGASPKGWGTLMDLMLKRGYKFEELTSAGLVIQKDGAPGKGYDRFRERLMFPIRNAESQTIGFGARLLTDQKDQPKYLNSPESPLFSKRRCLYGMFENQRGIRVKGEAIIVEGYMDVVGLAEKGVDNAVATMGTALTEEHCRELKPLSSRVVTVFDPDAGGQDAWRRSVHIFLSAGIFARDLLLPDGKDPDEFVQEAGADAFYRMCEKAPRQITKLVKEIAAQGTLGEEESARWLEELTPVLIASRRLPPSERAQLWDDVSLVLRVSVSALKALTEASTPAIRNQKETGALKNAPAVPTPKSAVDAALKPLDRLDWEILEAALKDPASYLASARKTPFAQALKPGPIKGWLERLEKSNGAAEFEKTLMGLVQNEPDPRLQSLASGRLLAPVLGEATKPDPALLAALYERLAQRSKQEEIRALSAQIKLSERMGNPAEGVRLLERLRALRSSP